MSTRDDDGKLYRIMLILTIVCWLGSLTTAVANYIYATQRMKAGTTQPEVVTAPNYRERQYRVVEGGKPKKEFSVLGIEHFKHGFLSAKGATAMMVGSFFWLLIFLGYRGDYLARQREKLELEALELPPTTTPAST